jgi:hypothetical protein
MVSEWGGGGQARHVTLPWVFSKKSKLKEKKKMYIKY